ncbi:MAG: radical SAM protein [Theionarchaea archaeon]|nr:radical SAM protein [Theionarchaea archaeon]
MKVSHFKVIVPTETEGEYLLTNMMSGAIIGIDEEIKSAIQKDDITCLDPEIVRTLTDLGILIPDHVNEYRKFKVEYERRKYMVDSPAFTVITTYACNLACPYCYEGRGELLQGTMNSKTREREVTFMKKTLERTGAKNFSIGLYGGEPLLNFDESLSLLTAICGWADDKGIQYKSFMVTNGTLMTPEIAEALRTYRAAAIQLTLDGPKRLHDKKRVYKKGGGTFDDVIRAAHILHDHDIHVILRINTDTENQPFLGELLDELREQDLTDVSLRCGIVSESLTCRNYSYCVHEEDTRKTLADFQRIVNSRGYVFHLTQRFEPSHVFCGFLGEGTYVLDPHADVYKCMIFVGLKKHCIGHITADGEIEYASAYYDWMSRDPLTIEECSQCVMLPSCGGGCAAVAHKKYNTYHACGCYDPLSEMKDQLKWYLEEKIPQHFSGGKIIWQ